MRFDGFLQKGISGGENEKGAEASKGERLMKIG